MHVTRFINSDEKNRIDKEISLVSQRNTKGVTEYDRKNNKLDVIRHCAEVSEVASFAEVMQIKEAIEEAAKQLGIKCTVTVESGNEIFSLNKTYRKQ